LDSNKRIENVYEDIDRYHKQVIERRKKYPFIFIFLFMGMFILVAEDMIFAGYDEEMDEFNQMFRGDTRFLGDGNFSQCVIINNVTSICDWEIWMYNQTTATIGLTSAEANLTYINRSGDVVTGEWIFNGNLTISNNLTVDGYVCNTTNCYTLHQFLTDTTGSANMVYTNIAMLNESANVFTGVGDRYIEIHETGGGIRVELVVRNNIGYVGTVNNFPFMITTNNNTAIYIDTGQNVGIDMVPIHGKLDVGGSIWAEDWVNATNVTAREYFCNESTCYAIESFLGGGSGVGNATWNESVARGLFINRSGDNIFGNWIFNGNISVANNLTVYDYICNETTCYSIESFLGAGSGDLTSQMANDTYINRTGDYVIGEWTFDGNVTIRNNLTIYNYTCNATNCYTLEQFLNNTVGGGSGVGNATWNESTARGIFNTTWTESLARTIFNTTWTESVARTLFPTFAWVNSAIQGNRTDLANADTGNFSLLTTNYGSAIEGNATTNLTNVVFLNNTQTFTGRNTFTQNITVTNVTMSELGNYFCLSPDCSKFICSNASTIVISNNESGVHC